MDAVQRWLTLLTLVSAALAGMLYLGRQTWRLFQVLERITYELSPNHGASMKDDLSAVAVAVGDLQAQVRELGIRKDAEHRLLRYQLNDLTAVVHKHHPQHSTESDDHDER